jgi:hypothetical protein
MIEPKFTSVFDLALEHTEKCKEEVGSCIKCDAIDIMATTTTILQRTAFFPNRSYSNFSPTQLFQLQLIQTNPTPTYTNYSLAILTSLALCPNPSFQSSPILLQLLSRSIISLQSTLHRFLHKYSQIFIPLLCNRCSVMSLCFEWYSIVGYYLMLSCLRVCG